MEKRNSRPIPSDERTRRSQYALRQYQDAYDEARVFLAYPSVARAIGGNIDAIIVAYAVEQAEVMLQREAEMRSFARQIREAGRQIIEEQGWSNLPQNFPQARSFNLAWQLYGSGSERRLGMIADTEEYGFIFVSEFAYRKPTTIVTFTSIADLDMTTLQDGMENLFFDFVGRLPFGLIPEGIEEHRRNFINIAERNNPEGIYDYSLSSSDHRYYANFKGERGKLISKRFPGKDEYHVTLLYDLYSP